MSSLFGSCCSVVTQIGAHLAEHATRFSSVAFRKHCEFCEHYLYRRLCCITFLLSVMNNFLVQFAVVVEVSPFVVRFACTHSSEMAPCVVVQNLLFALLYRATSLIRMQQAPPTSQQAPS